MLTREPSYLSGYGPLCRAEPVHRFRALAPREALRQLPPAPTCGEGTRVRATRRDHARW